MWSRRRRQPERTSCRGVAALIDTAQLSDIVAVQEIVDADTFKRYDLRGQRDLATVKSIGYDQRVDHGAYDSDIPACRQLHGRFGCRSTSDRDRR